MSRRRPATTVEAAKDAPRTRRSVLFRRAFVAVLLLVTLVVVGDWVLHTSTFRVHHVEVVGAKHETNSAVILATGLESDPALIDVSDGVIARRLERFKWINTVSVSKHWPSTVRIVVSERKPVAVAYNARNALQLVDATGRDLASAPADTNLPRLVVTSSLPFQAWPFRSKGKNAALVASELPPAFSSQVDQVIEAANGNVSLALTTPVTFDLGPLSDLKAKFVAVASVMSHQILRAGDVVDVSVPDSPTITQAK